MLTALLSLLSRWVPFLFNDRGIIPVSRIEFVPESSVYWPIIGLGTRKC